MDTNIYRRKESNSRCCRPFPHYNIKTGLIEKKNFLKVLEGELWKQRRLNEWKFQSFPSLWSFLGSYWAGIWECWSKRIGFPGGSGGKEPVCNAGNLSSAPWSRRPPAGANGNPLEYSCLGNPMDRGAWWATVRGGGGHKSWAWLSN